jgi:hypothetical protein
VPRFMLVLVLLTAGLWAQQPASSTTNAEEQDPATETGKFKKNCPFKHLLSCAEVLFTGQPLHIAVGSIAPQNGFAGGLAYVGHKDTDNWSTSWSGDGVASNNASWRVGMYAKFVDTHLTPSTGQMGTANVNPDDFQAYTERPVYNLYAQVISLNKLTFFGVGSNTSESGRTFFGMTEGIVGGSLVRPIYARLNAGFYAELNGRWVDIRPSTGQPSPSIEQVYNGLTAPGLNTQPFIFQLGVGVRMRPSFKNNLIHLNYDVAYRPYIATDSNFSFQRLTIDLDHQISLYHTRVLVPRDTNGPNDCSIDPTSAPRTCPKVGLRSKQGTLGIRAFTSLTMTPGGGTVPFYFQPTLGGTDVNGNSMLSSYQDYRFRAPNLIYFREYTEHSIGSLPLGVALWADQGKVGITRGDLGSNHWIHSYAAGLTLRAGGFPQVYLLFAFGGNEGTHTIANMNTSLLGTSGRPSLF